MDHRFGWQRNMWTICPKKLTQGSEAEDHSSGKFYKNLHMGDYYTLGTYVGPVSNPQLGIVFIIYIRCKLRV